MSLEIRQMVVKSSVVRKEPQSMTDIEREEHQAAFREELLEECRRLILKQWKGRGER
jgi:hypothetical protein